MTALDAPVLAQHRYLEALANEHAMRRRLDLANYRAAYWQRKAVYWQTIAQRAYLTTGRSEVAPSRAHKI